MEHFANKDGKFIVENLAKTIQENAAYLSEVDGATGDGIMESTLVRVSLDVRKS